MKNKKLKLSDLKVQSFITALDNNEKQTIAGGDNTNNPVCNTEVAACIRTNAHAVCADTILDCSIGIACTYINCPSPL
jgi:hypothetical protein